MIVTISVVEDAQPTPQRNKNGRIFSQTKAAIQERKYTKLNPQVREKKKFLKRESRERILALKRARLEPNNYDQPLG